MLVPTWLPLASGSEGHIGVLRRVYGFDRCSDHGRDGIRRWVGLGFLTASLVTISEFRTDN